MVQKFKELPLEKQMFLSFSIASSLLLLITLCLTLSLDISRQRQSMDTAISNAASYIANLGEVSDMLDSGYPNEAVTQRLDLLYQSYPEIDTIAVYNQNGLRFYHTSRQEAGNTFVSGEELPILSGSEPYVTTGYGAQGSQRKAFHAIKNAQGDITGFVTVAISATDILHRIQSLSLVFFCILCAALLTALLLSHGIVQLLKNSLGGYHPAELLDLYLQQDDVLNAIEDGLIATDPDGTIVFANECARQLFTAGEDSLSGISLQSLFPETSCVQVIKTGQALQNRSYQIGDRQVLVSEVPIRGDAASSQGVLNIFHDKTEMRKLSDELSGARYMLDTLRFFNHEFMNKLHIILGYLQTGQTQQAIEFIMNTSLVSSQAIRETADCVRVSHLCALVIGKMMHASEHGILLTVSRDSSCREEDLLFPADDYATIIGNLLENAIEELSRSNPEVKEITLSIYCRPDCSIITCEDTGSGISPQILPHIWEKGVSSKGDNRGFGLYLVHQLVHKYGGTIQLDTEAGEGSCFTLTFTQSREEK